MAKTKLSKRIRDAARVLCGGTAPLPPVIEGPRITYTQHKVETFTVCHTLGGLPFKNPDIYADIEKGMAEELGRKLWEVGAIEVTTEEVDAITYSPVQAVFRATVRVVRPD